MFLLVPAYPGCPGSKAVERSSLFLVPAHPGSPGKRVVKRMCVCVCVCGVNGHVSVHVAGWFCDVDRMRDRGSLR